MYMYMYIHITCMLQPCRYNHVYNILFRLTHKGYSQVGTGLCGPDGVEWICELNPPAKVNNQCLNNWFDNIVPQSIHVHVGNCPLL